MLSIPNPNLIEKENIKNLAFGSNDVLRDEKLVKQRVRKLKRAAQLGNIYKTKSKILLTSTSEIYGDPKISPQNEEYWGNVNPVGIRSCYDEGKRCAETLFFDYKRQHKVDSRIVRIFNTYGPRMHPEDGRVVSNFIVQALQGKDLTIYGDGSQSRSFCFVDDLINVFIKIIYTTIKRKPLRGKN